MNEYFQKQIDGRSGVEDNMTLFYMIQTPSIDEDGKPFLLVRMERLAFTVGDQIKLEGLVFSHTNPKAPSIPTFIRRT